MYKGKFENNEAAPVRRPSPRRRAPAKKNRSRKGTIIFYSIYAAVILVFFVGIGIAMGALNDWLVRYEASQPKVKCQEVFEDLFGDPDWAEIYTLAGAADTAFEDESVYAAYMENEVGDRKLTYIETSAGLSGDKKYIVRLGNEKVATFTLTADNKDADIPDWRLGKVEIFFTRGNSFTIITDASNTVTVNGVKLDSSYTVRTVTTAAEKYLPEGVHGYRLAQYQVHGLLAEPEVLATNAKGEPVELTYDAETATYTQDLSAPTIGDSEYDTLLTAAQTYCRYMIGAAGRADLKNCFDSTTQIYNTITTNTTWMQNYKGYDFSKETITDFYRYSDTLYSAKVNVTLMVTRKNGTVKDYVLGNTFFVQKQDGQWKVIEMTNVNVQEQTTMVRLTYMNGSEQLSSELVDANSKALTPPAVTAPEGKVFSGWFYETVDENGKKTMSLAFLPDENGNVTLSGETALEPLTLHALFEKEAAE